MIEAVSGSSAAAPVSAPASAGGDFFSQILSAVMTGLASGAVNPEVCVEETAELSLAGEAPAEEAAIEPEEEKGGIGAAALVPAAAYLPADIFHETGPAPSDPFEAAQTDETFIPLDAKTEAAGTGASEVREADTAAFMMASALLAAPCRAAGAAAEEKAAPAGTEIKSPASVSKVFRADISAAVEKAAAFRIEETPAAAEKTAPLKIEEAPAATEKTAHLKIEETPAADVAVPASAEAAAGQEKKAAGTSAAKASGGESEVKNSVKPAEKSGAAQFQPLSEDLAAKFSEDKSGQSGERQAFREQKAAAIRTEPAGEVIVKAVKEALPEKAAPRDFKGTGADAVGMLKEAFFLRGQESARGPEAAAGHGLSAAGAERIAAAAEKLETSGSGRLSLEINEPGLGKVRVEMAIRGGGLNISLEVENKEAGKFLSAKVPELVEALSQRGLNSGVQLFTGADGGRNGAGREERAPARRFANAAVETAAQEDQVQEEGRISLYV